LLERIQPDAAGIDCGEKSHWVALARDRDAQPVRELRTFTADLHRLADWLAQCCEDGGNGINRGLLDSGL
jgi:transposase